MRFSNWILTPAICAALALNAYADMKITTKTTVDGHSSDAITYVKGDAVRSESPLPRGKLITIDDCGRDRVVQINEAARTYFVTSLTGEKQAASSPEARSSDTQTSSSSTITVFEDFTDSGERRDLFRRKARRIKGDLTADIADDSCFKELKISSDAWYIDAPTPACMREVLEQRVQTTLQDCGQDLRYRVSGIAHPGYPVILDYTLTGKSKGAEINREVHEEVTNIETYPLDASLFRPPAGYKEVNSFAELLGKSAAGQDNAKAKTEGPPSSSIGVVVPGQTAQGLSAASAKLADKRPGVLRIGVAPVTSSAAQPASLNRLQAKIITGLQAAGFDAVPLAANPDDHEALEAEAKSKECDYFVTSDIGALKQSTARGTPRTTAQIAVKAYLPDQIRPVLDGENNYTGGDTDSTLESLLKEEVRSISAEIKRVKR